jgi:hypothetical protein
MIHTRRLVPVLQGITLIALAAAAAWLAWPNRVSAPPAAPTLPSVVAQAPATLAGDPALADSIVNTNMFSLTREAPEERTFAAAPVDPVIDDVTSGEYAADAGLAVSATAALPNADPVPALYGVVNGPSGRAALLRLDPKVSGSRLFRLGEGTAGYRVHSIGADRVELTGPQGTVVLELAAKGGTP